LNAQSVSQVVAQAAAFLRLLYLAYQNKNAARANASRPIFSRQIESIVNDAIPMASPTKINEKVSLPDKKIRELIGVRTLLLNGAKKCLNGCSPPAKR
jgi:hypothetical protein